MKRQLLLLHCGIVTSILVVVSLLSRLLVDSSNASSKGAYLLEKAMYWYDVAQADDDDTLRIEHCATAVAFMDAAREVATDNELETAAGIDLSKLSRRLERSLVVAREARTSHSSRVRV